MTHINRIAIALIIMFASGAASADLRPPPRSVQAVTDPSMIVMDRGAKLEVFPTKRATTRMDSDKHTVVHQVTPASSDAPIGPTQLGVVFNHAMQQQGYITGEIAFKVKSGRSFSGSQTLYPNLKQLISPSTYVVNARTPGEFIKVLKRLQARTDLAWVEPTVTYGPAASVTPRAQ